MKQTGIVEEDKSTGHTRR